MNWFVSQRFREIWNFVSVKIGLLKDSNRGVVHVGHGVLVWKRQFALSYIFPELSTWCKNENWKPVTCQSGFWKELQLAERLACLSPVWADTTKDEVLREIWTETFGARLTNLRPSDSVYQILNRQTKISAWLHFLPGKEIYWNRFIFIIFCNWDLGLTMKSMS